MKKETTVVESTEDVIEEVETSEWFAAKGKKPPSEWDWRLIKREWNRLKMPQDLAYDVFHIPMAYKSPNRCGYYMLISKRGVGKTTSMILLGLILFKLYGTVTQYIRQVEGMTTPKNAQELMSTILGCGYIEKITEGRWNYATYYANRWTFAKIDSNGKITEKSKIHFMYTLSVDKSFYYKSNYNAPTGDLTIFDEFINKNYTRNEFIYYLDTLSTIIRKRTGVINVLLSNNIDEFSEYFEEFEIEEQIKKLKRGDCTIATTSGGTKIYIEMIDQHDKNAARLNKEFFGFRNPRLYAITGTGDWNVPVCKHYDYEDDTAELIDRTHYIEMGLNMVAVELWHSEKYGYHCRVHRATKIYDDSVIYTRDEVRDKRYRQGYGYSKVDQWLWDLLDRGLWHFATNSQKNFVDKYIEAQ